MIVISFTARCLRVSGGRLAGNSARLGASWVHGPETTGTTGTMDCLSRNNGALHVQPMSTLSGRDATTPVLHRGSRGGRHRREPGHHGGRPELVIFDKHGTLINFNSIWGPWLQAFTSRLEASTCLGLREQIYRGLGVCSITGRARHGLLADGTRADLKRTVEDILLDRGLTRRQAQLVVETCWEDCDVNRPGAVQQLEDLGAIFRRLKESNIKIAVYSPVPRRSALKTLRHLNLAAAVDTVACTDDPGVARRTDWRQIHSICKELKVDPQRTVLVGDSSVDMVMGKDAGVGLTVGVLSGVGTRLDLAPYADFTVPTVREAMRHVYDASLWRHAPRPGRRRHAKHRPADGSKASLVIFDKDGTLICFNEMWTPWVTDLVRGLEQKTGLTLSEKIFTDLGYDHAASKWRSGLMAEATMAQVRDQLKTRLRQEGMSATDSNRTVDSVWEDTTSVSRKTVKPLDDPSTLFQLLQDVGVKVAVCTSDSRAATQQCLREMAAEPFIDLLVCGDDPNTEPKPSGHNALLICRTLGVEPTEAVVVGDTLADMGMGRSAELGATVAVLTGVGGVDDLTPQADHVVPSIKHVLGLVAPEYRHSPIITLP